MDLSKTTTLIVVFILAAAGFCCRSVAQNEGGLDDLVASAKLNLLHAERQVESLFTEFHDPIINSSSLIPKPMDPKRWSTLKRNAIRDARIDIFPVLSRNPDDSHSLSVMVSLVGEEKPFYLSSFVWNSGSGPIEIPLKGALTGKIQEVIGREYQEFRHEWIVQNVPQASEAFRSLRDIGLPNLVRLVGRSAYIDHQLDAPESAAWMAACNLLKAERALFALTVPVDTILSGENYTTKGRNEPHSGADNSSAVAPSSPSSLFMDSDLLMMGVDPETMKEPSTRTSRFQSLHDKININTASKTALETLPGIGSKLAAEIIRNRPYHSVEDLSKIRGIGDKTVESIAPLATVE